MAADFGGIVDAVLRHDFGGALDDASDARFADEHVMRFLGQHEPGRTRKRIESRLGQRAELILAVTVREVGEHEK